MSFCCTCKWTSFQNLKREVQSISIQKKLNHHQPSTKKKPKQPTHHIAVLSTWKTSPNKKHFWCAKTAASECDRGSGSSVPGDMVCHWPSIHPSHVGIYTIHQWIRHGWGHMFFFFFFFFSMCKQCWSTHERISMLINSVTRWKNVMSGWFVKLLWWWVSISLSS